MTAERGPQRSGTFRVFVSSTFSDLKVERDALQRFVFPRLRELCANRGARFQAIDLRWGVSEEAGLDQRTMSICLGEIERCQRVTPKPNFIVLLGDRYGWRPLPPEIPATEFAVIEANVTAADDSALLSTWYRLDTNAVPPVWWLQPRRADVEEGAGPDARRAALDCEAAEWGRIEARLHTILSNAIAAAGLDEKARVPYEASATEQEILRGALEVPGAAAHVFCFFRTLETPSGVELARADPTDPAVRDFVDGTVSGGRFAFDAESHERLEALKEAKLRPLLGEHVHDYRATWAPEGIGTGHIGTLPERLDDCLALLEDPSAKGTLCLDVWRSLGTLIRAELDLAGRVDQLRAEITAHEDFGRQRCRHFVGREESLAAIARHLAGADVGPLVIVGEPGSGKSALMAKAIEGAQEADPDAFVVARFIGATPASADGRALLDSLCRQITRAYDGDESTVPSEYNDLAVEFGKRLALATAERPLIIVLDALDQLSGDARGLSWLPAVLPANVRLAVSTLPGECEKALLAKHPTPEVVEVRPMTAGEAETLLSRWLDHAGRALTPAQREEVLTGFDRSDGLPLYLRLAFEEARLWRSNAPAGATVLHDGVQGLIRENLFPRLSAPANHGSLLVRHALGYLAASRFGLSEDEVLDLLSADGAVLDDFAARSFQELPERRLPVVVWSRLFFDVEPYLTERSAEGTTLLAFYHNQLRDAATAEYLAGEDARRRNAVLASYFRGRADPARDRSWTGGYARGLGELPYHLAEAREDGELYATLTDFTFLEHKAAEVAVSEHPGPNGSTTRAYGGVYALQDDFELAIAGSGDAAAHGGDPRIVAPPGPGPLADAEATRPRPPDALEPLLDPPTARPLEEPVPSLMEADPPVAVGATDLPTPTRASGEAPTLSELLAASGLRYVDVGGGAVAMSFESTRAERLVVHAKTLERGVALFAVPLPKPGLFGGEAVLRCLLRVTFGADYVKALVFPDGELAFACEQELGLLSPARVRGLVAGLAALGDVKKGDLADADAWDRRLLTCRLAQAADITLDPIQAGAAIRRLAAEGGLRVREAEAGAFIVELDPLGTGAPLAVVTRVTDHLVSLIAYLGDAKPKGDRSGYMRRMLELNRSADIARMALDADGDVALLYEVPGVEPDLFDRVREQFGQLLVGLVTLERGG